MSASDWFRNTRGEWFVIAQTALMLAVLVAPKLDGRNVFWTGITGAAGGPLCIVGLGFVVLESTALGRNLSPFPKPKEKGTLVESGIFSVVRHPIYSGFSLAAFGWSLLWNSIATLIAALLLLAFFDKRKARRRKTETRKRIRRRRLSGWNIGRNQAETAKNGALNAPIGWNGDLLVYNHGPFSADVWCCSLTFAGVH